MNKLEKYNTNFLLLPLLDRKKLVDLLQYKSNIIKLRKSAKENKICAISYFKKTTGETKQYNIFVKSYYIRFDTKQIIVLARDVNDKRKDSFKTFFLENIENIEVTDQKNNDDIKINLN